MSIKRIAKNSDTQISTHVHSSEIDCHCDNAECSCTFYDDDLIERFERLRLVWSYPIEINSAFRCSTWNLHVGGAEKSVHMIGKSLDLVCPDSVDWTWFKHECAEIFEFTFEYENCRVVHCDVFERS